MNRVPSTSLAPRPLVAPLRHSRFALIAAVVASVGLVLLGLDGLTSGHFHVDEGSLLHHRHLFNGEHQHDEETGLADDELAHHDHATSEEDESDHDDEAPDGRSSGATVSTLELAGSLAAQSFVQVAADAALAELVLSAVVVATDGQFSPTEGPRPPPVV